MKLANLNLQNSIVRCRHAAARDSQAGLRHQAAPREQLIRRDAMPASHQVLLGSKVSPTSEPSRTPSTTDGVEPT